jgi:PAS domain S-box-containing protein
MAQDITEKEQTRTELNRLNETLDRMVRIRTGALEAANRELAAEIGRREVLEDFSKQLSQIIWETPDVVAICAPDGRLEFLNKAGRALFGLKEDQAITHLDLYSAYSEEGRERVRSTVMPLVLREGIWRGESEFRRPDGSQIPISQVLLCQKDAAGDVLFFACIARDISNQKHVEQELRQSRERYRTLAEAAHDFIFMVSPDGVMEYANNFSCQLLGFSPEAVAGTPVDGFFPPDFAANHLHLIRDVQDVDRPVYTEGPFQLDGQVFWLGTWLVPIHSDQGALVSILGISRDITEQKKTDEALQRALQNERRLSEMRSSFFSMTSHQFRTPLNTILLSTQMLQKYGARLDETKRTEQLSRIQEAALRLNAMLEDILLIGRAESGRYVVAPKLFDLVSYCRETINEIAANDQDAHPFHFSPEAEPMPVFLDTEVLHRLLDNLFSNAVKYSPAGAPVTVRVRKDSELVVLEVTDQGIGIPERDMKFLFQPFQRGSNAVDFPGSGIGLTIIQKSVELLGGSISVKSVEGQGSTFLVRFPARMERPSQPDMA